MKATSDDLAEAWLAANPPKKRRFFYHKPTPYQLLLMTPEWREFRKYVIARDGYRCMNRTYDYKRCPNVTCLEVDHKRYLDLLPWEYDDEDVWTLCRTCHKRVGRKRKMKRAARRRRRRYYRNRSRF